MLKLISHPTSTGRQRLFFWIMVVVAYLSTTGYGIFLQSIGANSFLSYVAGSAFLVFLLLGIAFAFTRHRVVLFRIGIFTVAVAFTSLILSTGGIESPAIHHLLIIPILSFFYKPFIDRYIVSGLTMILGIIIGFLTFNGSVVDSIGKEYQSLFSAVAHFYFFTIFFSFIFIFSYSVRKIHHKLNHSMDELKSTTQKLVDSEKMATIGQMMAGLAHEINNPVNYVKGCSGQLSSILRELKGLEDRRSEVTSRIESDLPLTTQCKGYLEELHGIEEKIKIEKIWQLADELLESIDMGSEKTVGIIKSLSFYARDHKEKKTYFDLNKTIDTTIRIVNHRFKSKIGLEKSLGQNIPLIKGNEGRISQVFLNLIVNAIDACPEHGGVIRIESEIDTEHSQVIIRISDNGQGIPLEIRNQIFDPFYTTKEIGKGTGLGLSISKEIIEEQGGNISFTTSSQGTSFLVKLPLPHQLVEVA
jgi:signal transduction histidine kinase